ncbi:hypothetical protein KKHLCK_13330 [Candidatus Electrothrix laxa]
MICSKKTAMLTLSLVTAWSVNNALALPQNNGPKPPPQAYTACEGKQPEEKTSFTGQQGKTISGVCEEQEDGRLFLRPENLGKGKGNGNGNGNGNGKGNGIPSAAYQNCVGKTVGDSVQVSTPTGRTISGTCQSDGDRLYLRPDSLPGMKSSSNKRSFQ